MAIRIGIYGYGNLGKGAELAVRQAPAKTIFFIVFASLNKVK